jgi:hypothetical protein
MEIHEGLKGPLFVVCGQTMLLLICNANWFWAATYF